jgi:hypothetical protein
MSIFVYGTSYLKPITLTDFYIIFDTKLIYKTSSVNVNNLQALNVLNMIIHEISEALTSMKMSCCFIVSVVTTYGLIVRYQHFGEQYYIHL